MSRYITWANVIDRYPSAAKIAGAEIVNSSWLWGAEAEIDARLSVLYTVPFSPAPDMVRDLCIDLLYSKMTAGQESSQEIYKRVQATLKEIVNGTIPLPGVDQSPSSVISTAGNSYRSAFGVDDPINWSRSVSQIEDAQAERNWD